MNRLFDTDPDLPDGCYLIRQHLDRTAQEAFVMRCRELFVTHPLMQPITKYGTNLSLKVTSWGKVGWFGGDGKYEYIPTHSNGKPWPEIPMLISTYISDALRRCNLPETRIDTVLLNHYPAKTGKLGRHQDVTEDDHESPIVTFSLGDSCIFNIGSTDFDDKGVDLLLESGDVVVMSGPSRLAYHQVKKVLPETSELLKNGGRISLTARKVFV